MSLVATIRLFRAIFFMVPALLAASVGPLIFPIAQAGHGNLAQLATHFLLPAVVILGVIAVVGWKWEPAVARSVVWGAVAGAMATIPLEVVRLAGFKWGYMPGNLPRLMGVLLLDRFALGPSTTSDIASFAYHFWNGASFGIIYALFFGTARRWVGLLYGVAIGLGFLVSPVVVSMGAGYFGLEFSKAFPVTVLTAHLAFGVALGFLAHWFPTSPRSPLYVELRPIFAMEFSRGCSPRVKRINPT